MGCTSSAEQFMEDSCNIGSNQVGCGELPVPGMQSTRSTIVLLASGFWFVFTVLPAGTIIWSLHLRIAATSRVLPVDGGLDLAGVGRRLTSVEPFQRAFPGAPGPRARRHRMGMSLAAMPGAFTLPTTRRTFPPALLVHRPAEPLEQAATLRGKRPPATGPFVIFIVVLGARLPVFSGTGMPWRSRCAFVAACPAPAQRPTPPGQEQRHDQRPLPRG
jgi:hypothetical protein